MQTDQQWRDNAETARNFMFTDPEASIIVGKQKATHHDMVTRKQYPYSEYADICYWGNGVGCDGGECWCPCHGQTAPMFISNIEVERWHSDHH